MVKHKLRVANYELRITSWKLKNTSWNSKVWVHIHELRAQIHELRVKIHELWVQIYELQVQIYELKKHLINENSSKQPQKFSHFLKSEFLKCSAVCEATRMFRFLWKSRVYVLLFHYFMATTLAGNKDT